MFTTSCSFCALVLLQFRNAARIATYANFLGVTTFRRLLNVGCVWLFSATFSLPEIWLKRTYKVEVFNSTRWKCGENYDINKNNMLELIVETFLGWYSKVKLWWVLCLGCLLPMFMVLIFSVLIKRRLIKSVRFVLNISEKYPSSTSSSPQFADSYGTYSTIRSKLEHSNHAGEIYPESVSSARTNLSLVKSQYYYKQRSKHQPINSFENFHMVPSSFKPGNNVPHSPLLSVAMKHGISLLSLNPSNTPSNYNIGSVRTTTSGMPPHRRNFRRRNSRVARHTVDNADAESKLLWAIVSTTLIFFMFLQVPVCIFQLLSNKNNFLKEWTRTFIDASQYLNCLAFIINPVVMMFSYPAYKDFLLKTICCLKQKSLKGYIADF